MRAGTAGQARSPAPNLWSEVSEVMLPVRVIEESFEDAGEQGANGRYDYYYAGVIYRLDFPHRQFHVRRYDHTPGEAHFLAFGAAPRGKRRRLFETIPYDDVEFRSAVVYVRDTLGAGSVNVLLPAGYTVVDFSRLGG